ncbi:LacI family DNA-binding transcriptional regulator [Streptomyces millisiae]|uniref:LacI family DNA-binding transcriptional regulator n=1 Tax=Streptomyces millisiae TaxID=3075542 RepID=A0ABU2LSP2_9ACTN|nr:LacI family DNA-binding transcriptional regulator [Streptomyces sp. DSM 44918]MDT0320603.1 LacI family DNA-binding transcriptional regulator [Streptomyces sp. DSM 44918]
MTERGSARPPSMVDVAREAGVAHVTVSRVLNNHPSVRPGTRDRVVAAIERLGYRRNDVARSLKSGRSMTIGVVIAGSELFELPRILLGVEEAAQRAGYWVNMSSWQGGDVDRLAETVDRLASQAAEGVAVIADRPVGAEALEGLVTRVPMTVVMSGDLANPAIGSVELDQELGARLATRHLLELGHREILHLTGRLTTFDARARVDGWRAEMLAAGVPSPELLEGDFSAASGYRLGLDVARRARRPTAVFAGNDQMAMGVLAAFAEQGVAVPGDVSLVGFDDIKGSEYLVPSLTTVRQDFVALGRTCIEVLLGVMGGERPRHHLIAPSLVARRSSAAPARRPA